MRLIVGLGNPGEKYKNTRHNVGFIVVDELEKLNPPDGEAGLPETKFLKPQKFMNRSGIEVKKWVKKENIKPENLYVIHDDLDIELGKFKIGQKGPRIHNGLKSIDEQLGFSDYWHVRIGIDNRMKTGFKGTGEEYVLQSWRPEEREIIKKLMPIIISSLIDQINGKR